MLEPLRAAAAQPYFEDSYPWDELRLRPRQQARQCHLVGAGRLELPSVEARRMPAYTWRRGNILPKVPADLFGLLERSSDDETT